VVPVTWIAMAKYMTAGIISLNLLRAIFITIAILAMLATEVSADFYPVQTGTINLNRPHDYSPSKDCANCHLYLYQQFEHSMHAKAFTNPVFQNQLYDVLLPQMKENPNARHKVGKCLACHSPTIYMTKNQQLPARHRMEYGAPGVTCDFCHTMISYSGKSPENANYVTSPGPIKYGPFKYSSDWHRKYSPFHTSSKICGVCHEGSNSHGVQTHTTYSEWLTSSWPKKGVECQDCHMSATGRLIDGKAIFERGIIAAARYISPPERKKLFSHRFPGTNVLSQLEGAVKLKIYNLSREIEPGDTIFLGISLDNSEAGHSMPTGAIELRQAWLDVRVSLPQSGQVWQLKAERISDESWDTAGMSVSNTLSLDNEITPGSRLYRAVLVDSKGRQTFNNWQAVSKVFDNRLKAGEIRREMFRFTVPADALGNLDVEVKLYYLRYPPAFVTRLGMKPAKNILVAKESKIIKINY